jgi:hypothetical protein
MKRVVGNSEYGQSLVLISIFVVGFVAMLLLVLDGGNAYFNRRVAQTAADAGALAGARAYCEDENESAAVAAALDYVGRNGAQATSGDVTVNTSTGEVQVVTQVDFSIFFGGIAGRPTGTATALAAATCTPPSFAISPLPVAWSCHPPILEDDAPEPEPGGPLPCDLDVWDYDLYGRDPNPDDPEEAKHYYLVMDSINMNDELICVNPPNSMYDTECDGGICDEADDYIDGYVDCDTDNDYDNDVFGKGDRSWVDLDGGGGGANELIDYIKGEIDFSVLIHTWMSGQDGNAVSVYHAVNDYLIDQLAIIPVFDMACPGHPEDNQGNDNCQIHRIADGDEADDIVTPNEGQGKSYFHIISFALFKITCVRSVPNNSCPIYDQVEGHIEGLGHSTRSIEGYFVSGFAPDIGSLPIPGAETGTYIIKLTR